MVIIDRKELGIAMKTYDYNQKELAEILIDIYHIKVNYRGLNKMINNKQTWNIDVAYALSDILDVPFEQLFKFNWE